MALTAKQKLFADVHEGNTTEAAAIAGISREYGARLMQDVTKRYAEPAAMAVQERIRSRNVDNPAILTRIDRQELWSKWALGIEKPTAEQLRASELLGKSEADFVDVIRGADSMLLVLGSPRKQIESKVVENHDETNAGTEAEGVS